MKIVPFGLKPHSLYLLMLFLSGHIFAFIGMPYLFDDHRVHRSNFVLALEYLIILSIVYYEVLTITAFVYHTINPNFRNPFTKFYLLNMKWCAAATATTQIFFYIILIGLTKKITEQHLMVWGLRLAMVLSLLYFQFSFSGQLLQLKDKVLEELADEESISIESEFKSKAEEDVEMDINIEVK